MNIGINLLFLKPGLAGGTETYSRELLGATAQLPANDMVFYIFCSSELDTSFLNNFPNFKIVRYNKVSRSLAYRYFFEQIIFPFRIRKYKLNVLHSYGYVGPVFVKNHVVTIHDTNAFAHKNAMPLIKRLLLSFFLVAVAKKCSHIITVSQFSKSEILKYLKVPENKISVIYEACKTNQFDGEPISPGSDISRLLNETYFLGISSLSPHKNIQTLVDAFKILAAQFPSIKLVLAGHLPKGSGLSNVIADSGVEKKIFTTGFISDQKLAMLFKHTICFVFPSVYEGFGLPLIEAQNMGVPVIASDKGSLPEIGGKSALYFPSADAYSLSNKMKELLLDDNKRAEYIKLGLENVLRFSWIDAAKKTLKIYTLEKK